MAEYIYIYYIYIYIYTHIHAHVCIYNIWVNNNISLAWTLRPYGDDIPQSNHDSRVRENSEVVIIYPDYYPLLLFCLYNNTHTHMYNYTYTVYMYIFNIYIYYIQYTTYCMCIYVYVVCYTILVYLHPWRSSKSVLTEDTSPGGTWRWIYSWHKNHGKTQENDGRTMKHMEKDHLVI